MRFFICMDAEIFRLFPYLCKPYFLFFAHKLFLLFILELSFLITKCNMILYFCANFVIRKAFLITLL
jgi:hypothetical protein